MLTSNHLYEIASNKFPLNLANNLKPGFSQSTSIEIGLISLDGQLIIVVGGNKAIQLQAQVPLSSLNISLDQTFYVGLTSSGFQNGQNFT
jgi:hypothetical protein